MKKLFLSIAALLSIGLVVSCGGGGNETSSEAPSSSIDQTSEVVSVYSEAPVSEKASETPINSNQTPATSDSTVSETTSNSETSSVTSEAPAVSSNNPVVSENPEVSSSLVVSESTGIIVSEDADSGFGEVIVPGEETTSVITGDIDFPFVP